MKPTQQTNRIVAWRFSEIGILVSFDRELKLWLGTIKGERGSRPLPFPMLDTIITTHNLERYV